ncbi:MAG: putative lipid II flippase FtsW [Patescibacteria group bacterium]
MRDRSLPFDKTFLWLAGGLTLFGIVMLMSASGPLGFQTTGDSFYFLKSQLLKGILPGVTLFFLFAFVDYRILKRFAFPALIASVVLLVLVYMPGIGLHLGGSSRWISVWGITFQPSEFVKVAFLIYVAAWLSSRDKADLQTLERGLVPFLLPLGVILILLIKQPNTGTTTVMAAMSLACYFVTGAPLWWFGTLAGLGGVGLYALINLTSYRAQRFMTFLHPELDPNGVGYHINQAFLAVGSGGLFGLGYGQSRQKFLYLPEVASDSIFAVMAEELGFVFMLIFLAVLAAFVWRCFQIGKRAPDSFGTYLATGVGAWVAAQSILNIGSMIGLMPITGVTLPFMSYGSSAFVALAIGCGIVASVSRQASSRT